MDDQWSVSITITHEVAKVRSDKDVARGRAKEDRRGGWR
jgi:hypothetical protein